MFTVFNKTHAPQLGNKTSPNNFAYTRIKKHLTGQSQVDVMRWIAKRQNLAKNDRISATARVTSAEMSGFDASPRVKKPCCIEGKSIVAEPAGRAAMNEPPEVCINGVKSEFGSSG